MGRGDDVNNPIIITVDIILVTILPRYCAEKRTRSSGSSCGGTEFESRQRQVNSSNKKLTTVLVNQALRPLEVDQLVTASASWGYCKFYEYL